MKVKVIKREKARFINDSTCIIETDYDVYVGDNLEKRFDSERQVDNYITYLQQKKKDNDIVIKEIEI
jgi:hypothetical protein